MIAEADYRRALAKCDCATPSVVDCYSDKEEAEAIEAHKNRPCPYHGLKHRRKLDIYRHVSPETAETVQT
jgi:hypothetical protein